MSTPADPPTAAPTSRYDTILRALMGIGLLVAVAVVFSGFWATPNRLLWPAEMPLELEGADAAAQLAAKAAWLPDWKLSTQALRALPGPATDVILHMLRVLCLGWLVAALCDDRSFGWGAALLYAVLPVQLGSISDLEGRAAPLADTFALLALVCSWLTTQRGALWGGLAVALTALATLELPTAGLMIAPLLWLLQGFAAPEQRRSWPALGALLVGLVGLGVALAGGRLPAPLIGSGGELALIPLGWLPSGLSLLYPSPAAGMAYGLALPAAGLAYGVGGGALVALLLCGLMARGACASLRLAGLGGVWFLLAWLAHAAPLAASGLSSGQLALASGGLALLLLGLLRRLLGGPGALAIALLLAFAVAPATFLGSYQLADDEAFWRAASERDGGNRRASTALALLAYADGEQQWDQASIARRLSAARAHLDRSRRLPARLGGRAVEEQLLYAQVALKLAGATVDKVERTRLIADVEAALARAETMLAEAGAAASAGHAASLARAAGMRADLWLFRVELGLGQLDALAEARVRAEQALEARRTRVELARLAACMMARIGALERLSSSERLPAWLRSGLAGALGREAEPLRDAAGELLREALRDGGEYEPALTQLGVLHFQRGERSEAASYLQRGLAAARSPLSKRELLRRLALLAIADGDAVLATEHWEALLAIDPDDSQALIELADMRVRERRYKSAVELLSRAVAADPDGRDPRTKTAKRGLANIFVANGELQFKKLLERAKQAGKPLVQLVREDAVAGAMVTMASGEFNKAFTLVPEHPQARQRLALMYSLDVLLRLVEGKLDEALAIQINQLSRMPWLVMADRDMKVFIQEFKKKPLKLAQAVKVLQKAREEHPRALGLARFHLEMKLASKEVSDISEEEGKSVARINAGKGTYQDYYLVAKARANRSLPKRGVGEPLETEALIELVDSAEAFFLGAIKRSDKAKWREKIAEDLGGFHIRWANQIQRRMRRVTPPPRESGEATDRLGLTLRQVVALATYQRLLGRFAHHLGSAERLLEQLLEQDPQHTERANNLALVYQRQNRYSQAIAVLARLESKPPHVAYLLAGMLLRRAKTGRYPKEMIRKAARTELRVADLELAVTLMAGDDSPRSRAIHDEAKRLLERGRWAMLRAQGITAWHEKRLEQAAKLLEQARAKAELDFDTNYYLGLVYRAQDKLAEAARVLELARARRDKDVDVLIALADCYYRGDGGDLHRALAIYQQLVDWIGRDEDTAKLFPKQLAEARERAADLAARYKRYGQQARELVKAKQPAKAAEAMRRCLQIRPKAEEVRYQLGSILVQLGQGAEAVKHLTILRKLRGQADPYVDWQLGRAQWLAGDTRKARALFEGVIKAKGAPDSLKELARKDLAELSK